MATVKKSTNKPVKKTSSKKVVAGKHSKSNLSSLQKRVLIGAGVVLVAAGGYFGYMTYQDNQILASGWTTVTEKAVNKQLKDGSWLKLGTFKMKAGKTYRYCVVGTGDGKVNLQPDAFGTIVEFRYSNGKLQQSLCTKSFKMTSRDSVGNWEAAAAFDGYINPKHTKPITIKKFVLQQLK